jgi:hypothetical protein
VLFRRHVSCWHAGEVQRAAGERELSARKVWREVASVASGGAGGAGDNRESSVVEEGHGDGEQARSCFGRGEQANLTRVWRREP